MPEQNRLEESQSVRADLKEWDGQDHPTLSAWEQDFIESIGNGPPNVPLTEKQLASAYRIIEKVEEDRV